MNKGKYRSMKTVRPGDEGKLKGNIKGNDGSTESSRRGAINPDLL